jgi:hypothetical protein
MQIFRLVVRLSKSLPKHWQQEPPPRSLQALARLRGSAVIFSVFPDGVVKIRRYFRRIPAILNLKTAAGFEQKDTKDTKSVTCEGPAQI